MTENSNDSRRPWFRKKRVGYGYSPNTWQGWAITAVVVIVVVIVAIRLAGG